MHRIVILDNIRSAHNVGSIFRTADGAGAEKIYLVGTTPCPLDRFGRVQREIAKTSLGASESVAWEHVGDPGTTAADDVLGLIERLKADSYTIVAVEQTPHSVSLYDFTPPEKVAYIFGAEVTGVQPEIITASDVVLEIPMSGLKESLNVSVTAGIVLFRR